jgi:hypothetical protein
MVTSGKFGPEAAVYVCQDEVTKGGNRTFAAGSTKVRCVGLSSNLI